MLSQQIFYKKKRHFFILLEKDAEAGSPLFEDVYCVAAERPVGRGKQGGEEKDDH